MNTRKGNKKGGRYLTMSEQCDFTNLDCQMGDGVYHSVNSIETQSQNKTNATIQMELQMKRITVQGNPNGIGWKCQKCAETYYDIKGIAGQRAKTSRNYNRVGNMSIMPNDFLKYSKHADTYTRKGCVNRINELKSGYVEGHCS